MELSGLGMRLGTKNGTGWSGNETMQFEWKVKSEHTQDEVNNEGDATCKERSLRDGDTRVLEVTRDVGTSWSTCCVCRNIKRYNYDCGYNTSLIPMSAWERSQCIDASSTQVQFRIIIKRIFFLYIYIQEKYLFNDNCYGTHKYNQLTHDACAAIEHDGKDSLESHYHILSVVSRVIWLDRQTDRQIDRQTETPRQPTQTDRLFRQTEWPGSTDKLFINVPQFQLVQLRVILCCKRVHVT